MAVVFEPLAKVMLLPLRLILPPVACAELASITPLCSIVSAVNEIFPPEVLISDAEIVPVFLMSEPIKFCAAFAPIIT